MGLACTKVPRPNNDHNAPEQRSTGPVNVSSATPVDQSAQMVPREAQESPTEESRSFPFTSGAIPRRVSSRGSTASFGPKSKGSPASPKLKNNRALAIELFDFESSASLCGRNTDQLRSIAIGLVAGLPSRLQGAELQRLVRDLLSSANPRDEAGYLLRQETCLELLVPWNKKEVSYYDAQICFSLLGPCQALTSLVSRCEQTALQFLLLKAVTWIDDDTLSLHFRSTALILLNKVLANFKDVPDPPTESQDVVVTCIERGMFENDYFAELFFDAFSAVLMRGWTKPESVWMRMKVAKRPWEARAYRALIVALSFTKDKRSLPGVFLTDPAFVSFVMHSLKIAKPRRTLASKLAFELLQKITTRLESFAFTTFCSLYQLFDDPNVHLLVDPLKKLNFLYDNQPMTGTIWQFSQEWTSIFLARAVSCGNPDVVKLILGRILSFDWNLEIHQPFPEWFLVEYLIPCLEMEELYMPSMFEATGAFRIQPTSFTTGKFKKNQEREEAKDVLHGFNLPDGLEAFFRFYLMSNGIDRRQSILRLFLGIRDLNNLSAVFTATESLTRAVKQVHLSGKDVGGASDDLLMVFASILNKHGGAGSTVNRSVMLIGCILMFVLEHSKPNNFHKVLRICSSVPDHFLRHDSLAQMSRDRKVSFLRVLGEYLAQVDPEELRTTMREDFMQRDLRFSESWGLVSAALQTAGATRSLGALEEMFDLRDEHSTKEDSERRWTLLVSTWVRLAGKELFLAMTGKTLLNKLMTMCWDRIESALRDDESNELLEDAWIAQGGLSRASLSEKRESLSYLALSVLTGIDATTQDTTSRAQTCFELCLEKFLVDKLNLRSLVVLSVVLLNRELQLESEIHKVTLLVIRLCGITSKAMLDTADMWLWPHDKASVATSTLYNEFLERKWRILALLTSRTDEHIRSTIENAAAKELDSRDPSPTVITSLVECLSLSHLTSSNGHSLREDESFWEKVLDLVVASKSSFAQDAFVRTVFSREAIETRRASLQVVLKKMVDLNDIATYEHIVKKMCALLLNPTKSPWVTHPELAAGMEDELIALLLRTDKLTEVLDYCVGLATRSIIVMREEVFVCRAEHTVHPSALVRFVCLSLFDECLNNWASLTEAGQSFLNGMALRVLKELETRRSTFGSGKAIFQENSPKYLSIALLVLNRALYKSDCERVASVLVGVSVSGNITADVKQNMEKVIVSMCVQNWKEVLPVLEKQIAPNSNGWIVMALLSCASIAWHRIMASNAPKTEMVELDTRMFQLALPWLTCSKSSIRVLAANVCINIKKRKLVKLDEGVTSILNYLESNVQMKRLMDRITKDQKDNSDLDLHLDLVSLLEASEFNLLGDLCPRDLRIDRIADLVRAEQADFFANFNDELFNVSPTPIDMGEDTPAPRASPSVSSVNGIEHNKPLFFFQKKIDTSANAAAVEGELGSARQPLIILASAVDKIPNIAGLARTCEVFRARTLVVNDASIVNDGEFKAISRTAENWLPIVEVKQSQVPEYLMRLRRDEGFTLVGLEQTTSSIPLQDMEWPSHGRVCLVLGAEGTGVPPDVLALLDATIEIPQFGYVKSLNVHVSGALCVWAYTEAMLAYGLS